MFVFLCIYITYMYTYLRPVIVINGSWLELVYYLLFSQLRIHSFILKPGEEHLLVKDMEGIPKNQRLCLHQLPLLSRHQ